MSTFYISQSNRIVKVEGLDTLVNLDELYLSDNGIEKIEGLDNNVSLSDFYILYCQHYCIYKW